MGDSDLDQVLAGRCIHGYGRVSACGTCQLTLYLANTLGRLLNALFPRSGSRP